MTWETFLTGVLGGAAALSVAGYLGRSLLSQVFAKELEKFKSDLEVVTGRNRFRFEKMHLERAEAIKQTYQKLVVSTNYLGSLLRPLQEAGELSEKDKAERFTDAANGFQAHFEENRIFFAKDIEDKVERFISKTREACNLYRLSVDLDKGRESMAAKNEAWKLVDSSLTELKRELEDDFRNVFGA
jgi:hypothetical protein